MKKMMLLALAAASVAMFALPAMASAGTWHLKPKEGSFPQTFTATGGLVSSLSTGNGETITCDPAGEAASVTTTEGSYENSTTGKMRLLFHGCRAFGLFNCNSAEQPTGTITTEPLPIHNVLLHTHVPAILVTPAESGLFAKFSCAGLTQEVKGNGVLGKVTTPTCDTLTKTGTVEFKATAHGVQRDTTVTTTGTVYGLTRGGAAAAQEATANVEFNEEGTIECTH